VTAKQQLEKNIKEEIQVIRRQQMAEMENLLTRQQVEHKEQLKTIKEEMEELRRQQIEHKKELKTTKEEMEEQLESLRIKLQEQQLTAKEELESELKQKIRGYQD
jgi:hypothetical protein